MMPNAESLHVLTLDQVAYPITYRWYVGGPWGTSSTELTVDAYDARDDSTTKGLLGGVLWALLVARATCSDTRLFGSDRYEWKGPAGTPLFTPHDIGGQLPLSSGDRRSAGCMILHTGDADNLAARRLAVPGIPAAWSEEGLLNETGMRGMESLAHLFCLGLGRRGFDPTLPQLLAYPQSITPTHENETGVTFRYVRYWTVMHHTVRAPDVTLAMSSRGWL